MPDSIEAPLRGKVLCIEDHEVNMILVEELLRQYPGITLIKAATGWDGVRLAQSERPDLVLLDMHLPDIGGLEVVRALNEEIYSRKLRIALLTGDALSMDIVKAMSLGAYEYWIKPLQRDKLDVALHRALNRPPVDSSH